MSSDSASSSALNAAGALILVAWLFDWAPVSSGEVVTYHAFCPKQAECKPGEMLPYRQTYRADKSTLTVTSWVNSDNEALSIHRDCVIRDKRNWLCNTQHAHLNQPSMTDGDDGQADEVSWYRWWWIRFLRIGE